MALSTAMTTSAMVTNSAALTPSGAQAPRGNCARAIATAVTNSSVETLLSWLQSPMQGAGVPVGAVGVAVVGVTVVVPAAVRVDVGDRSGVAEWVAIGSAVGVKV